MDYSGSLHAWLARIVPAAAYYAVRVARTVKACGVISNWIGGLSVLYGHPCLVVSVPGHFFNSFPLPDGRAVEVDTTDLQFRLPAPSVFEARRNPDMRMLVAATLDDFVIDPFKYTVLRLAPRPRGRPPDPYDPARDVTLDDIEAGMEDDGLTRFDTSPLDSFFASLQPRLGRPWWRR